MNTSSNEPTTQHPRHNEIYEEEDTLFLRYYVGHKGEFGHEYFEIECNEQGRIRYTNSSMYKKDGLITRQVFVNRIVMEELLKLVLDSDIMEEIDERWPEPDRTGTEELIIALYQNRRRHYRKFITRKIGSLIDVQKSKDPEGLTNFYYFVQNLKSFILTLISLHFKVKPI